MFNLVVLGGYVVAKKAQKGELDTLFKLPSWEETEEVDTDKQEDVPVSVVSFACPSRGWMRHPLQAARKSRTTKLWKRDTSLALSKALQSVSLL